MKHSIRFAWLVPALYVAFAFGSKIIEGFSMSDEFIAIISVIPFLAPHALLLTPMVGCLDFAVALVLLVNPFTFNNVRVQRYVFAWATLWPFVPSTLRYVGGVAEFEIVEVVALSLCALCAWFLWERYTIQSCEAV